MKLQPIFDINDRDPATLIKLYEDFPSTGSTGAKITHISENLDTIKLFIPFIDKTKNFMGIAFGGSMYSATDPIYVTMLWYRLGNDYLIIDKHSEVEYLRPGLSDLTAEFCLPDSEITAIIDTLTREKSTTRSYTIDILDDKQKSVCRITKTIYIRKRPAQ